jgi:histidinol-phosphate aminotransferase
MTRPSDDTPIPRAGILDIEAYKAGESRIAGRDRVYKLSSNESPLGPSPKAIAAARDAVGPGLALYPDGHARALTEALAETHALEGERIVCGNGSDEILWLMAQGYVSAGDEVVVTEHAFAIYAIASRAAGGTVIEAPERNFRADVDAILERVNERTRIVFLANPNNPTGSYLNGQELRRLRGGLPGRCLLVLDGAYAEYVRAEGYDAGATLARDADNVVMTRTFSKAYGLAALRLGFGYCPAPVADVLHRIRGPFNVNGPAQAAGIAALADRTHLDAALAHNDRWLPWLADKISALGLEVAPSAGNFLLVRFPGPDGAGRAEAADAFLKREGVILRRLGGYGIPEGLRLSVGLEDANRAAVDALGAFLAQG